MTHYEAWYDKAGRTSVEWGPQNAYGLKGMAGGMGTWLARDLYNEDDPFAPTGREYYDVKRESIGVSSGGWYFDEELYSYRGYLNLLRAGFLGGVPDYDDYRDLGLRVAADLPSE